MKPLSKPDSVVGSFGAGAAAQVISRALGFVRGLLLAWLVPQAQYGLWGAGMLGINVLMPLFGFGLHEGVARYTPVYERAGRIRELTTRVLLPACLLAGAWALAMVLTAGPLGAYLAAHLPATSTTKPGDTIAEAPTPAELTTLLRFCAVCTASLVVYHLLAGTLRGRRRFRAFGLMDVVSAGAFTVLAPAVALCGYTSAGALIGAMTVSLWLAILPSLRRAWTDRSIRGNRARNLTPTLTRLPTPATTPQPQPAAGACPAPGRVLRFSAWCGATAVVWHAMLLFPVLFLMQTTGAKTVGAFYAVRMIAQLLQQAAGVASSVLYAHAARWWETRRPVIVTRRLDALTMMGSLAMLLAATLLSVAKPLVIHLFPGGFAAGSVAYDPLLLLFFMTGVLGLWTIRLNLAERSRAVFACYLVGLALTVIVAEGAILAKNHPASCTASTAYSAASPVVAPLPRTASTPSLLMVIQPSPRTALTIAAWAGAVGSIGALVVMGVVLVRRRLAPRGGAIWVTLLALPLGFGWQVALPCTLLTALAAWKTHLLIDRHQRTHARRWLKRRRGPTS